MKLRQHAAHYGVRHKHRTNLPCPQIFFHTFHGPFLTDSKTLIEYPSGFSPVLYRSGASFLHFFIGPSGNWPTSTRFILLRFPSILKTRDPSERLHDSHSSPYTFFRSLYTSVAVFPDLKTNLITARCFVLILLTHGTNTRLTSMAMKRHLLML